MHPGSHGDRGDQHVVRFVARAVAAVWNRISNRGFNRSADQDDSQSRSADTAAEPLKFSKRGGIVYRTIGDIELKCDAYVPDGAGPFPAVLAVHGGAWRSGAKWHMIRHARKLAAAGFVVVAINYRHAPSHRFPSQIEDCQAALHWMCGHAEQYTPITNEILNGSRQNSDKISVILAAMF